MTGQRSRAEQFAFTLGFLFLLSLAAVFAAAVALALAGLIN